MKTFVKRLGVLACIAVLLTIGITGLVLAKGKPNDPYMAYILAASLIEDAYHALVAKDQYSTTRLLLCSFGLIGIIGIRRKVKKS